MLACSAFIDIRYNIFTLSQILFDVPGQTPRLPSSFVREKEVNNEKKK